MNDEAVALGEGLHPLGDVGIPAIRTRKRKSSDYLGREFHGHKVASHLPHKKSAPQGTRSYFAVRQQHGRSRMTGRAQSGNSDLQKSLKIKNCRK
jgi:hypothetical protein